LGGAELQTPLGVGTAGGVRSIFSRRCAVSVSAIAWLHSWRRTAAKLLAAQLAGPPVFRRIWHLDWEQLVPTAAADCRCAAN